MKQEIADRFTTNLSRVESLVVLPTEGKRRLQIEKKSKLTIADLARHRGRSVDDLIQESVDTYLAQSNYNDVREVKRVLTQLELDAAIVDPHSTDLAAMMKRRHWIAHRADRNPRTGRGHRFAQAIDAATVQQWLRVVRAFGNDLLSHV